MYIICCKILGVKPGSDPETIKSAYRKAAKELHPDLNDSDKAHEYFVLLKNAYEYLIQHPYSDVEAEQLSKQYYRRKQAEKLYNYRKQRAYNQDKYTLREILRHSKMARSLYVFFHILFIIIGLWLIYHSLFDLFFHPLDERAHLFSAYSSIFFGFIFGIALTVVFILTGYSYLQNR